MNIERYPAMKRIYRMAHEVAQNKKNYKPTNMFMRIDIHQRIRLYAIKHKKKYYQVINEALENFLNASEND